MSFDPFGSLGSKLRFGLFSAGCLAMGSFILNWARDEPVEVTRAREIVDEHDRKERLTRILVFFSGCTALYLGIRLSAHIATREREDGEFLRVEEVIPMDHVYSE